MERATYRPESSPDAEALGLARGDARDGPAVPIGPDALDALDASPRAGSMCGGPALARMLIDCMPWPAALVADDGVIAFANRPAQSCPLVATLAWRADRRAPATDAATPQPLAEALRRAMADPAAGAVTLRWPMPGRARPARVAVMPLPDLGLHGAQALVTVHDPQSSPVVDRLLLARRFGLTPAQARVAARMVEGQSPAAIADETGVSLQTVCALLQAVVAKLSADRHTQLVWLLLGLSSAISIPPNGAAGD